MKETALEALSLLRREDMTVTQRLERIAAVEQKMDDMTVSFRQNQFERIFERIGDHVLNIGQLMASNRFQPESGQKGSAAV